VVVKSFGGSVSSGSVTVGSGDAATDGASGVVTVSSGTTKDGDSGSVTVGSGDA